MRNTQYNIKYSSMDQFYIEMCNRIGEWHTQLESWSKSFNNLINMKSFDGQAAEKVKAYLGEVHVFLLEAIYTSIERLQSDYLLYKKGYYNIEGNIYANISSETIKSIQTKLSDEIRYLNNIKTEIDRSLNSVSDIYRSGRPSNATLVTNIL